MAYDYHVRAYMGEALEFMPDYASALRVYESRKPYIKGKHKGERPLGRNRRHDRSRISLDDMGNVIVKHWQTNIIVYKPDGGIILSCGGYQSISTAQIMQELLGIERICRVHCKIYYRNNESFYFTGTRIPFEILPNGKPLIVNDEYVYVLRRDKMKEYRKRYHFFLEYAKHMLTMSSDFRIEKKGDSPLFAGETLNHWYLAALTSVADGSMRYDRKAYIRARDALFGYLDSLSQKPEEEILQPMYELMTPVAYMFRNKYSLSQSFDCIEWQCNYSRFKSCFDVLLKEQYPMELFSLDIAPKTQPVRDPNRKFVV